MISGAARLPNLRISLDERRYLPNANEPVDRWFQAGNGSNARTTAGILRVLAAANAVALDPFAGAGSTAAAARFRGMAFYGIEVDPVLACVSLVKAQSRSAHLRWLPDLAGAGDEEWLPEALRQIAEQADPSAADVTRALAVVAALRACVGRALDRDMLARDLAARRPEPLPGRVVVGDATSSEAWNALELPDAPVLMYSSPPFGSRSASLTVPAFVRVAAASCCMTTAVPVPQPGETQQRDYGQLVLDMFRQALPKISRGTVVLEHEPNDEGQDSVAVVAELLRTEFDEVVHDLQVNRFPQFSSRGPFTLITLEIR